MVHLQLGAIMGREKSSCVLSSRAPELQICLIAGECVPNRSQHWCRGEICVLMHCRRGPSNGMEPVSWRFVPSSSLQGHPLHLSSSPLQTSWAIRDHSWDLALPETPSPTLDPTETSRHSSSSISPVDREATPLLPVVIATCTLG